MMIWLFRKGFLGIKFKLFDLELNPEVLTSSLHQGHNVESKKTIGISNPPALFIASTLVLPLENISCFKVTKLSEVAL